LSPKKKIKKQLKPVAPTEGQKTLRQEINRLNEKIEDLNYEIKQMGHLLDEYRDKVRELKLHHGGLEYIISYLESRLGIKENDGTTV
jgi:predicted  nucleic acid-binding Zn-ribbon protein